MPKDMSMDSDELQVPKMGDEVRKDLKILIVDDMVTMRRILKHLISLGFKALMSP